MYQLLLNIQQCNSKTNLFILLNINYKLLHMQVISWPRVTNHTTKREEETKRNRTNTTTTSTLSSRNYRPLPQLMEGSPIKPSKYFDGDLTDGDGIIRFVGFSKEQCKHLHSVRTRNQLL